MPVHTHSLLGASSARRWLNCPGSIARGWPYMWYDSSSVYAAEGTLAHSLGETCLRYDRRPEEFLDEVHTVDGHEFKVTVDMVSAVRVYVDFIREHPHRRLSYTTELEARVDLGRMIPPPDFRWLHHGELPAHVDCNLTGTADTLMHRAYGTLCVYDYKHGHTLVEVDDNEQLRYYALAALATIPQARTIRHVEIGIIQPNEPHAKGPIRTHELSVDKLVQWGNEVLKPGIRAASLPNAVCRAGSWCHYCPASGKCDAEQHYWERLVTSSLGVSQSLPEPQHLDPEAYGRWLAVRAEVSRMDRNYRDYALRLAKSGTPITGHKLARGRTTRTWRDEATVRDVLTPICKKWNIKQSEVTKLRTPKQVEQALSAHGVPVEEMTKLLDMVDESSSVQLVPADDPRPEIKPEEPADERARRLLTNEDSHGDPGIQ